MTITARALRAGLVLALLAAPALPAGAQGRWTVTPSLRLAERYDDNIFDTARDRVSDFVTEGTLGLRLGYQGSQTDLAAGFSVTGEAYAEETDLNNFGENRDAYLNLGWRPGPRTELRLAGYFAHTNDPTRFLITPVVSPTPGVTPVPTVGIERREVSQYSVDVSGRYQLTSRLGVLLGYEFTKVNEQEAPDSTRHLGRIGATWQWTTTDQLSLAATGGVFLEDSGDTEGTGSLQLGWARQWSPRLRTSLAIGPGRTGGEWHGAVDATLGYQLAQTLTVNAAYRVGSDVVVGETGPELVSALSGGFAWTPLRQLTLEMTGGWTRSEPLGSQATGDASNTYFLGLSASYRVTTWASVTFAYQYSIEDGTGGAGDIRNNQVTLGVTLAPEFRY
jgi:hypothetical protein